MYHVFYEVMSDVGEIALVSAHCDCSFLWMWPRVLGCCWSSGAAPVVLWFCLLRAACCIVSAAALGDCLSLGVLCTVFLVAGSQSTSRDLVHWSYEGVVLSEHFHLSYPDVFK